MSVSQLDVEDFREPHISVIQYLLAGLDAEAGLWISSLCLWIKLSSYLSNERTVK